MNKPLSEELVKIAQVLETVIRDDRNRILSVHAIYLYGAVKTLKETAEKVAA